MKQQQDFSDIGDWIRGVVEDAVGARDFTKLNQQINDTVNSALDETRRQLEKNKKQHSEQTERMRTWEGAKEQNRQNVRQEQETYRKTPAVRKGAQPSVNESSKVPGILLTVFGSIGIGLTGITAFVFLLLWMIIGDMFSGLTFFFLLLCGGAAVMLASGNRIRRRVKRAKRYLGLCRGKTYCGIKELADKTGQSEKYVVRDLRQMIKKHILKQSFLDRQGTCLMLDDEVYQQYLSAQSVYEQKRAAEKKHLYGRKAERLEDLSASEKTGEAAKVTEDKKHPADEKFSELLQEGHRVMEELRRLNDEIPGEAVSARLEQLDNVLRKIFEVVREHPDQQSQLRKFMDYYLPTTVRLVTAYADFDRTGIEGENITSAKAEIEKTLETIYGAFKKLLDSLYQDAAMAVSVDARVLETMLAQDGYTESDFVQK